jgi:hypothetical protein
MAARNHFAWQVIGGHMSFRRLLIIFGMIAVVSAAFGVSRIVGGAKAGPNPTENGGSGGQIFHRVGF